MGIKDLKTNDDTTEGSTTYIEVRSDGSDAEQEAYALLRRGGRLREGVNDINELYSQLTPLLADVLFEDDPSGIIEWLELTKEDFPDA